MVATVIVATAGFLAVLLPVSGFQSPSRAAQAKATPAKSTKTAPNAAAYRALLDEYCVDCHNQTAKTAGLMLDKMDVEHVSQNPDVWEKAIRKLRGGMMPPQGNPRPDAAAVSSFVNYLETSLDRAAAADANPGRASLHRLNR